MAGNSFLAMSSCLLEQLIIRNPDIAAFLYENAMASASRFLSSTLLSKDLLSTALGVEEHAYIVLDGLHHCSKQEVTSIISFFVEKASSYSKKIYCLIASRDDGKSPSLRSFPTLDLSMDDLVQPGILMFCQHRAKILRDMFDLSVSESEFIGTEIASNSQGRLNQACHRYQ